MKKNIDSILEIEKTYRDEISTIYDLVSNLSELSTVFSSYFFGKLFSDGYTNYTNLANFNNIQFHTNYAKKNKSTVPKIINDARYFVQNDSEQIKLTSANDKQHVEIQSSVRILYKIVQILRHGAAEINISSWTASDEIILFNAIFNPIKSLKFRTQFVIALVCEFLTNPYLIIDSIKYHYDLDDLAELIWKDLFDSSRDLLDKFLIANGDDFFFRFPNIEVLFINSASELINSLPKKEDGIYYRGHGSLSWYMVPSLNRGLTYTKETVLYNELLIRCPADFEACRSHLDYLVKMQHYGIPTRLLDITSNPLVALYFACVSEVKESGEVIILKPDPHFCRYEKSDRITLLSALPLFSVNDQEELYKLVMDDKIDDSQFNLHHTTQRFLQEVKTEKPAFRDEINKRHLAENYIVTPALKNSRILKQSGAFIITGLVDHFIKNQNYALNEWRYYRGGKKIILVIPSTSKSEITQELDQLNINKASLFPEIQEVSDYLINRYT